MQLTALQTDAVTEMINIAFSRAAASLSEIAENRVDLEVPDVTVHPIVELWGTLSTFVKGEVASVHQVFTGPVAGDAFLLLNFDGAAKLVDLLTKSSIPSHYLGASAKEVVTEVGNILLNACLGVFGNLLKIRFSFSVPRLSLEALEGLVSSIAIDRGELEHALVVGARFKLQESEVTGCLVLVLGITSLSMFVAAVEAWAERSLLPPEDDE
ncbi:chemotaxis protein CheC [soil metagenome]